MGKRMKTAKISTILENDKNSTPQVLTPEDKLRIFVNIAIDRVMFDLKNGKLKRDFIITQTKNV